MLNTIILTIAFIALVIGTITDIKTREVPNWISYSLIFIGLGLRLLYSAATSNIMYFVYGLAGLGVFWLIALAMFYTGQWGGGDSKLLMGLGALIGLRFSLDTFLISFFINLLLMGAVYGSFFAVVLALVKRKKFIKGLKKLCNKKPIKKARLIILILTLVLIASSSISQEITLRLMLFTLGALCFIMFYVWIFVKVVEKVCMIVYLPVSKLTEGDWIAKDVIVKGKFITGPKDLGISKSQIAKLKKLNINRVLVKQGIPFVPSFLAAFVLTIFFGNLFLLLI